MAKADLAQASEEAALCLDRRSVLPLWELERQVLKRVPLGNEPRVGALVCGPDSARAG